MEKYRRVAVLITPLAIVLASTISFAYRYYGYL